MELNLNQEGELISISGHVICKFTYESDTLVMDIINEYTSLIIETLNISDFVVIKLLYNENILQNNDLIPIIEHPIGYDKLKLQVVIQIINKINFNSETYLIINILNLESNNLFHKAWLKEHHIIAHIYHHTPIHHYNYQNARHRYFCANAIKEILYKENDEEYNLGLFFPSPKYILNYNHNTIGITNSHAYQFKLDQYNYIELDLDSSEIITNLEKIEKYIFDTSHYNEITIFDTISSIKYNIKTRKKVIKTYLMYNQRDKIIVTKIYDTNSNIIVISSLTILYQLLNKKYNVQFILSPLLNLCTYNENIYLHIIYRILAIKFCDEIIY